jgi:hypothetical protein
MLSSHRREDYGQAVSKLRGVQWTYLTLKPFIPGGSRYFESIESREYDI